MKKLLLIYVLSFFSFVKAAEFKLGIENISDKFVARLKGKRVGLITNQTGLDQDGNRSIDLLRSRGINVTCLFAPEHGFADMAQSEVTIKDTTDIVTKIPVISLYKNGSGKMIPPAIMQDIDVIMFDIQDSGMRHYTYISTLYHALKAASQNNKEIVVLDRPNPLGAVMEGPVVMPKLRSFISIAEIPLRHGMTVGELAWFFNSYELEKPANLSVVKMDNYNRRMAFDPFLNAPLSPGLRTLQAGYGYSFLGLLGEIAPFSICLNTDARYQCIALPEDAKLSSRAWSKLSKQLKSYGIDTVAHEYEHPQSKRKFKGLRLNIRDINEVKAFHAFYAVLNVFKEHGVNLSFSKAFDISVGTKTVRELFQGQHSHLALAQEVNEKLQDFYKKAEHSFMYTPAPAPVFMH